MSYANFKPIVWSNHIQRALEQDCRIWDGCNHEFEGEAKRGARVKILGVARPTIGTYTGSSIGAPEDVADSSVYLDIDQAKFFNFGIDDVDKAQSKEGLMPALMKESSAALAEARDKYVAEIAGKGGKQSTTTSITTADGAKSAIDAAFQYLWEGGVKITDKTEIILPPWLYLIFRDKLTSLNTDNPELIKKGVLGMYSSGEVSISNCLYQSGGYDYAIIRTKKAVAAVGQINEVEAYRPDTLFKDAVRGLDTYGAKVVRPKECYILRCKNS